MILWLASPFYCLSLSSKTRVLFLAGTNNTQVSPFDKPFITNNLLPSEIPPCKRWPFGLWKVTFCHVNRHPSSAQRSPFVKCIVWPFTREHVNIQDRSAISWMFRFCLQRHHVHILCTDWYHCGKPIWPRCVQNRASAVWESVCQDRADIGWQDRKRQLHGDKDFQHPRTACQDHPWFLRNETAGRRSISAGIPQRKQNCKDIKTFKISLTPFTSPEEKPASATFSTLRHQPVSKISSPQYRFF